MEQLPSEVILDILLNLSFDTLLEACKTNSMYFNICKSDYFWREKIAKDFDIHIDEFPEPHLQFYMALQGGTVRQVPVYFYRRVKKVRIGKVWIGDNITDGYILQSIERILEHRYPGIQINTLLVAPLSSTYNSLGERLFREHNSINTYISNDVDEISVISVGNRR